MRRYVDGGCGDDQIAPKYNSQGDQVLLKQSLCGMGNFNHPVD